MALTAVDGQAGDKFGWSVGLTPDGSTAIIGGPGDDVAGRADQGSAWVFSASAMGWSARGSAITPMDGQAGDGFGTSVAISGNGLVAILGAPGADVAGNMDQGGALVFAWDGTGWNQRGAMLTPEDGMAGDMFGSAVALSSDGLTALVGGPGAHGGEGAARSFAWTGTIWVEGLPATTLHGPNAMSPEILGTEAIDILAGTDGADIFDGLAGLDTMIGLAGDDQYRIRDTGARIVEDAAAPGSDTAWAMVSGWTMSPGLEFGRLFGTADQLSGSDGGETLVANQALASSLDGGAGNDMIWGGPMADLLIGGAGDDTLQSGAGFDTVIGGTGGVVMDLMVGGPGDDQFIIQNAGVVVASGDVNGDGYDTAWVQVDGWTLGLDIELARLITDNARLTGNAQGNVMSTEGYNTTLDGAAGNDQLWGSAGPDMLIGGPDNDTLIGGDDVDTAWFSGNQAESRIGMRDGVVIVSGPDGMDMLDGVELLQFGTAAPVAIDTLLGLGVTEELALLFSAGEPNYVLPTIYTGPVAGVQTQLLGGAGGEVAFGTSKNDFINMLGGDDAIDAGPGDDVVDGGTGSNFLTGGAGRDDFFLDGRGGGNTWSTITDWQTGERLSVFGWKPGVSQVLWLDSDGTPGFTGVTMHADLDGNGLIDTSVTWSGKARADLPVPFEFDDLLWFV
jgi:Ca2+-binding RTX toxin-like protein